MLEKKYESLYKKLMAYEVEVPEFQMKKSLVYRWANLLFTEAPMPFSNKVVSRKGAFLLHYLPIPVILVTLFPIFL